jgi:hypothetical protein
VMVFTRPSQALHQPAHRGEADTHACGVGHVGASRFQGGIGMGVHQLSDKRLGRGIQPRLLAARLGFRPQLAGAARAAQHLLDKRKTPAEHVGEGALGAQPSFVGLQNFLTEIKRIGSHISQASAAMPDAQVQTAI